MAQKRVLLCASYSSIEPLGLLHLAGLARDEGWERKIHLIKDHNFEPLFEKVRDYRPDIIGFNLYTGNHKQTFEAVKKLRKDNPQIQTIAGGPHPTYFPIETSQNVDFAVMREGFGSFREILRGNANPGILYMKKTDRFPHPDRKTFYDDYPEHAKSPIKSFITMTGCPYSCTYCYNSSTPKDINLPSGLAEKLAKQVGSTGRLFPKNVRTVDDIIKEANEVAENWPTQVLYCQDDVHGFDIQKGGWLEELAQRWPQEVDIPYHAQMRWEMTKGESGDKRLDLIKSAGGFGLTLAIEAAEESVRREVLHRPMPEELMYQGMKKLVDRGFKVRTEQIIGLPYGATTEQTKINLDADIGLVRLNVDLFEKTGGPHMAWSATFAPYIGTKLESYTRKFGHYNGDNNDVPDTFFERSVMKFPKKWVGPELENQKDDPEVWLSEEELEKYRDQNAELRRIFNFVTQVPKGDILARSYLTSTEPFSYERLGKETEEHLKNIAHKDKRATQMLDNFDNIMNAISHQSPEFKKDLTGLLPYFACLPKGNLAVERVANYNKNRGNTVINPKILSDAIRHHLYDEILYKVE